MSSDSQRRLPPPSGGRQVTLSGGSLSSLTAIRGDDNPPINLQRIETDALVELLDGTRARVVEVHGKKLSRFGIVSGSVDVALEATGEKISKSPSEVVRVIEGPRAQAPPQSQHASLGS